MRIKITDIATGKTVHHGYYAELAHVWEPVSQVCAEWFGCSPDDVHAGESDDGDTIEVNGKPVATLEWIFHRAEKQRAAMTVNEMEAA